MRTNHNPWLDVRAFHIKFKQEIGRQPRFPTPAVLKARLAHIHEELRELHEAVKYGQLEEFADALIDLQYLILGTGVAAGLPWPQLWKLVHSANMRKVLATSAKQSKRGIAWDVVKPRGWKKPDFKRRLRRRS